MEKETKGFSSIVVISYWSAARELIAEANRYASRIKLKNNLLDSTTAFKVQHVLDNYYEGKMDVLVLRIKKSKQNFLAKVRKFNLECKANGVEAISSPESLLNFLLEDDNRKSFKEKIKSRLEENEICSLQSFLKNN